jgi:hypothetical protein
MFVLILQLPLYSLVDQKISFIIIIIIIIIIIVKTSGSGLGYCLQGDALSPIIWKYLMSSLLSPFFSSTTSYPLSLSLSLSFVHPNQSLYWKIIEVCYETHKKHTNTLFEQDVGSLMLNLMVIKVTN